jgi:TonB family protein
VTPPTPNVYTEAVPALHPPPRRLRHLAWGAVLLVCPTTSFAQSLPTVAADVLPAWPVDAAESARSGEVRLEVGVDAAGQVTSVAVLSSSDPSFEPSAVTAMWGFTFEPARDAEGQPVAATVQYALRFEAEALTTESLHGRLREAGTRRPLSGGLIEVACPPNPSVRARTDLDGRFVVWGLQPGACTVRAGSVGHEAVSTEVELGPREVVELTIHLRAASEEAAEVVDVIAERDPPEIVERRMSADDIRYLPGSAGDVVRAVQNMPGLARAPFGLGALIVRGADPESTGYSFDGMDVPLVFHFGGLSTVLNPELVDEVSLMPGGWGVRYGRKLGGRLDVRTRLEVPERHRGSVSLDLFQATAFAAVRASPRTGVFLSLRRSYIDAVLTPLLSDASQAFRAPRYYDAQARLVHRMPGGGSVDALFVVSDDRFETSARDAEGNETPSIGYTTAFQKLQVTWRTPVREGWQHSWSLLAGPDRQGFLFRTEDEAYERRFTVALRDEHVYEAEQGTSWRMGFDLLAGTWSFLYDVAFFGPLEEGRTQLISPALYVEPSWRVGPVRWTAGVRGELTAYGRDYLTWAIDPRGSVTFQAGPTSELSLSLGRFSQAPPPRQVLVSGDGTPNLRSPWALQASIGLDQQLPEGVSLRVTGFYHHMFDLVAGREERFRFFVTPPPTGPLDTYPYGNEGLGRAFGAELLVKWESPRALALLSATFGRAERKARLTGAWVPFAYDQPYLIQALATVKLPKRWRVGSRVRVGAGNPYTAVEQRVFDLDRREFVPLFGGLNEARLPPFFSLDLRVDKTWVFNDWELSLYLDLQNVTNQRNVELMNWSWDYDAEQGIAGLPIVPAFGLRGDW